MEKSELVRPNYDNVSSGNIERDREIISQNIVHVSVIRMVKGIEAFTGFVKGFRQTFPDMRTLVEGRDTVVAEGVFIGTNTGPMMSPGGAMPATGKKAELAFCDIWKVKDARITENRIYYD